MEGAACLTAITPQAALDLTMLVSVDLLSLVLPILTILFSHPKDSVFFLLGRLFSLNYLQGI